MHLLSTFFLLLSLSVLVQALPLELPEGFWDVGPGNCCPGPSVIKTLLMTLPEDKGDYYYDFAQQVWESSYLVTINSPEQGNVSLWLHPGVSSGGDVATVNERLRFFGGFSSPFDLNSRNGGISCTGPDCRIDFVYNVPQLVTFRIWSEIEYLYDRQGGPDSQWSGPVYVASIANVTGAWEPAGQDTWIPSRHTSITAIPVAASAVPEPATVAITGAGLAMLTLLCRRRS